MPGKNNLFRMVFCFDPAFVNCLLNVFTQSMIISQFCLLFSDPNRLSPVVTHFDDQEKIDGNQCSSDLSGWFINTSGQCLANVEVAGLLLLLRSTTWSHLFVK